MPLAEPGALLCTIKDSRAPLILRALPCRDGRLLALGDHEQGGHDAGATGTPCSHPSASSVDTHHGQHVLDIPYW